MAAILTEGLTKAFGPTVASSALDLDVAPGEVLGYLGPNGAGKTTTIRLLLGLIRPTAGRARDLRRRRPGATRSRRTAGWPTCPARRTCGRR